MNGRLYDPVVGRFLNADPFVQMPDNTQNFNRYSYCLNNPLKYNDPDGEFFWFPVIFGAVMGGWMNGSHAFVNGGNFWDGAWKGALVGAVGGTLSNFGGGAFLNNVLWGAGGGTVTGGLSAALDHGNVGNGMLWGAVGGALFSTLTSENFRNWTKGEKFLNNQNVYKNMIGRNMDKQEILDYFGFEGTYDPDYIKVPCAGSDPVTGQIGYNDAAFAQDYNSLKAYALHEEFHTNETLTGKVDKSYFNWYPKEEYRANFYSYKNQGLYPHTNITFKNNIKQFGIMIDVTPKFHWWDFIYKIPRRF